MFFTVLFFLLVFPCSWVFEILSALFLFFSHVLVQFDFVIFFSSLVLFTDFKFSPLLPNSSFSLSYKLFSFLSSVSHLLFLSPSLSFGLFSFPSLLFLVPCLFSLPSSVPFLLTFLFISSSLLSSPLYHTSSFQFLFTFIFFFLFLFTLLPSPFFSPPFLLTFTVLSPLLFPSPLSHFLPPLVLLIFPLVLVVQNNNRWWMNGHTHDTRVISSYQPTNQATNHYKALYIYILFARKREGIHAHTHTPSLHLILSLRLSLFFLQLPIFFLCAV